MASDPGTDQTEVFDASKQAKTPSKFLISAPQDAPAVRVGLVSPTVGYGLFAARDFAKDECVFHEAPLMTALFNEMYAADPALVQSQVAACRAALVGPNRATAAAVVFPALAGHFGIASAGWDEASAMLGSSAEMGHNLVHGRFAGSCVEQAPYEAYIANVTMARPGSASSSKTTSETAMSTASRTVSAAAPSGTQQRCSEPDTLRAACLDFFKHYAFVVDSGASSIGGAASTREACVYLLASLVNHCCSVSTSNTEDSDTGAALSLALSTCGLVKVRSNGTSNSNSTNIDNSTNNSTRNSADNKQPTSTKTELPPISAQSISPSPSPAPPLSNPTTSSSPPPLGPNTTWRIGPSGLAHFVRPRHISVQARRAIRAGEQLTWDYGKRDKGFSCLCDTCCGGGGSSLGSLGLSLGLGGHGRRRGDGEGRCVVL